MTKKNDKIYYAPEGSPVPDTFPAHAPVKVGS